MAVEVPGSEAAADDVPMDVEEPNADVAMEMVDAFGAPFVFERLQGGDL